MMNKEKDGGSLKTKVTAPKNKFTHVDRVREIDVQPPVTIGDSQIGIKRFRKDKVEIDKNVHKEGALKK